MDFDLTEEQRLIRDSARRLMQREVAPHLDRFPHGYIMTKGEISAALKMLQPLKTFGAGAAHHPVNFVSMAQQKLRQIRAVLPRNSCY